MCQRDEKPARQVTEDIIVFKSMKRDGRDASKFRSSVSLINRRPQTFHPKDRSLDIGKEATYVLGVLAQEKLDGFGFFAFMDHKEAKREDRGSYSLPDVVIVACKVPKGSWVVEGTTVNNYLGIRVEKLIPLFAIS
jgi:hypothetical protein